MWNGLAGFYHGPRASDVELLRCFEGFFSTGFAALVSFKVCFILYFFSTLYSLVYFCTDFFIYLSVLASVYTTRAIQSYKVLTLFTCRLNIK